MSLTDVIAVFKTDDYTVTRADAAATYVKGRLVDASTSTILIAANVQPYKEGRETQPLPEGVHSKDVRSLFTTTLLHPHDDNGIGDSVAIDSEDYIVYAVEDWAAFGGQHYKAYASRRNKP